MTLTHGLCSVRRHAIICLSRTSTVSYLARLCQHQSQTLLEIRLAEVYFNLFIINATASCVLSMRCAHDIESKSFAKQIGCAGITRV